MRLAVHDVIGDDDDAVSFGHMTAEREGKSLASDGIVAFKISDQGKFTELWFLYSDQRAYDEFFR